jgi:uncharacterized membrane protein YeiH
VYLYLSVIVAIIVFLAPNRFERLRREMLLLDALGLGTFLVIGTSKALDFRLGFIGSILMGVMTATLGGLIRDVLSNEIPLILQREIYASACVAGGAALYLMHLAGIPKPFSLTTAALLVVIIRFAAILRGWQLPRRTDI